MVCSTLPFFFLGGVWLSLDFPLSCSGEHTMVPHLPGLSSDVSHFTCNPCGKRAKLSVWFVIKHSDKRGFFPPSGITQSPRGKVSMRGFDP